MDRRFAIAAAVGLALAGLVWWLLLSRDGAPPPVTPPPEPVAQAPSSARPTIPGAVRGGPVDLSGQPAAHLPQLQAGPADHDPSQGPANLPPGAKPQRVALSGKLSHAAIEDYMASFQDCADQHPDPDRSSQALLSFTITAEPTDEGDPFASVTAVQVLTGDPALDAQQQPGAFEGCCVEAVRHLELDPPGGRGGGQARFVLMLEQPDA